MISQRLAILLRHRIRNAALEVVGEEGLYNKVIGDCEKVLIKEVLRWHKGNQSITAAELGINRNTLRKLIRKHWSQ